MNLHSKTFSILLAGLLLSACGDDGGDDTMGGTLGTTTAASTSSATDGSSSTSDSRESGSSGGETSETGTTDLSYSADIEPILVAGCATENCHDGVFPPELSEGAGYGNIVGQSGTQAPDLSFVEPGSSDDSYLWHKINDTQADVGGSGTRMPSVGDPLSQDDIDTIAEWIDGGAPE